MKTCIRCHHPKLLSEFHKQSCKVDGHRSVCKSCRLSDSKSYYMRNQEVVKEKWKKYLKDHPDYNRNYYLSHSHYFEKYRTNNALHYWQWRQNNKRHLAAYRLNLKKTDPNFKVACTLRSRISELIRKAGVKKELRSTVLLGCSITDFRRHLESQFVGGMSWDNYGKWHIDHIIPCSLFDLTKIEEQKKCFHYTNQRPLWALDNLRRGNR